MDELEFRKLLDLFPVVRSRDYHVRLPLSLSLLFFISTFHSFPLSNLQSTIILKTHISIEFFWNNIYIFFNLNIRQNQRRQESQPLSQCRMRRYEFDSTILSCVYVLSVNNWCFLSSQQVKEWQSAWDEGDKKEVENQGTSVHDGMSYYCI